MSERKPIDWTKPLRVVGTGERVEAVRIERDGTIWVFGQLPQGNQSVRVDRRGGGWIAVENIPSEPRIVERFGYAYPCGPATYGVYGHQLLTSREAADEARRIMFGITKDTPGAKAS